ncbi:protein-tyrosine-phosphatase [Streptomyces sp. NWU339]|uniref:tyrosine-protein phosphatase n=1 Tax=Streptomyces sp. NWU339 TaxID=2185284 RepID=UPI000D67DEC0|nr:tyrosine-protein phosphatase [Streptomyces sp. NWU339]PWI06185.1 protein-tyrosine-phosphatase [Streptomyces sp. NWU339]
MLSAEGVGTGRTAPSLVSVPNFRDVAGPGYSTPYGPMRPGRLFRSNAFLVSPEEMAALTPLGIVAIYDLRTAQEVELRPDSELPGATWRHTWVPGLPREVMKALRTAADLREAMLDHYRGFVTDPDKRAGFAAVLSSIANQEGPQLFHCSEGKDRTGWVTMLLQRLVGVAEEDVAADFLLTNDLMRGSNASLEIARQFFGDRPDDFFVPGMIADMAYLEAGTARMETDYGDVEGYLRRGLGLSDEQVERLRRLLLD